MGEIKAWRDKGIWTKVTQLLIESTLEPNPGLFLAAVLYLGDTTVNMSSLTAKTSF